MNRSLTVFCAIALATVSARAEEPKDPGAGFVDVGVSAGVLRLSTAHQLGSTTLFPPRFTEKKLPEVSPGLSTALRVGLFLNRWVGIEAEGAWAPLTLVNGQSANVLHFRGTFLLQWPVKSFDVFFGIGGAAQGVQSSDDALGNDFDGSLNLGGGLKWHLSDQLSLRLDVRDNMSTRYSGTFPANSWEGLVGATWTFGPLSAPPPPPPDADVDGIPDEKDSCPNVAAITENGCPLDSDGDSVVDTLDKCPKILAKTADGCPPPDKDSDGLVDEKDACPTEAANTPDGCPVRDRDQDGVPDEKDACADLKGSEANGCPPDDDKDGVWNADDKCPSVAAKTADGCFPDTDQDGKRDDVDKCPDVASAADDGCPFGDPDKDGLTDDVDRCKDVPETVNGYLDQDGCEDVVPKDLAKLIGPVGGFSFDKGKATVAKASDKALGAIAKLLAAHAEAGLEVTVYVPSDKKLDEAGALALSQARADAFVAALVKKGVAADRLAGKGKGTADPILDKKGKPLPPAKQERVEFKWTSAK